MSYLIIPFGVPGRYRSAMFLRRQGAAIRLLRCNGGVCALQISR
jgi:hypothetical protein